MKTVNDFLSHDCFVIKDTENNNENLGLQINAWGERNLSEAYGERPVLKSCMETGYEIWGSSSITGMEKTLVLYI